MNTLTIIAIIILFLSCFYRLWADMQNNNIKNVIISTIIFITLAIVSWNVIFQ